MNVRLRVSSGSWIINFTVKLLSALGAAVIVYSGLDENYGFASPYSIIDLICTMDFKTIFTRVFR